MVGLFVVAAAALGISYLWFRQQVVASNQRVDPVIRTVLSQKPTSTMVSVTVPVPPSPSAMNVLVLGSDKRADEADAGSRSDTIILAHIDPDNNYFSLLSLPRDLRVDIPGKGTNKLNAAYALGGPALTIQTVEEITGVDINHYVEVSFDAFKDITDSLGGVYVYVDQHYYNANPNYEMINLAPGYQLLHGADALDYVRYRHDLNLDFGRMERQQEFLSDMREQAMGWDLALKLPGLVNALFKNVTTDLGANDIIKLAYWAVRLDGNRIRRVSLIGDATDVGGVSYVLADNSTIANAVESFLTLPGTIPSPGTTAKSTTTATTTKPADLTGIEVDVQNANGRVGEAGAVATWLGDLKATVVSTGNAAKNRGTSAVQYPSGKSKQARTAAAVLGIDTVEYSGSAQRITVLLGDDFELPAAYALPPDANNISAALGWKSIAKAMPFAIQGPGYIPKGYYFVQKWPTDTNTYDIDGKGGKPAFTMLYRLKQQGSWTDQYMGLTETTWQDAPAASKGREIAYNGRVLTIVGPSDNADRVWWKEDGVLYWVSNTLFHLLSENELVAVAKNMVAIPKQ